jgi:hypothetical protein
VRRTDTGETGRISIRVEDLEPVIVALEPHRPFQGEGALGCGSESPKVVTNVTDTPARRTDHGGQETFVDRAARARRRYV